MLLKVDCQSNAVEKQQLIPLLRLRLVKRFISHRLHTGAWGNLVLLTYLLLVLEENKRSADDDDDDECSICTCAGGPVYSKFLTKIAQNC